MVEEPVVLLERDRQLATLHAALAAVRESRGGAALVAGEAGTGKSELLRRFCDQAGPAARVLWAACDALFTPRPLGPLLDIARLTGGDLEEKIARGALPHDVAAELLRELARPAPTILVIEDLHWADEATLDVVRLLARRIEAVPALLAVSYRDEQLAPTHPLRLLLGELPSNPSIARLEVADLSREAVEELAGASGLDAAELYARTQGNPFFVTEVLAARTQLIPHTVRDAVLARAARLRRAARSVLEAVAIVPQRVELPLLERLVDLAPGALEECLASGMLRSDGDAVAYRHDLARLAIEASLGPDRRLALHRAALAALEHPTHGALDLARLAHHAEAAGDTERVLRFSPAAAEHAAALGAHREAEAHYARALRFGSDLPSEVRADLLQRFAGECFLTEMRGAGIDALAEAAGIHRARGDAIKLAAALRQRAGLLGCAGRSPEARADADEAVAVLGDDAPDRERAWACACRASTAMVSDDFEEAVVHGMQAIELAERVGDSEILIDALNTVGTSELTRGADAGLEKLLRSLALAQESGRAPAAGRAFINLVSALGRRREWGRAEEYIADGLQYCSTHGLEAWEHSLLAARTECDLALGRWSEATAGAVAVVQRAHDHAATRYDALRLLGLARARRGDPECWPVLDEALGIARGSGDLQYLGPVAAARAEAVWLEGRPEMIEAETADAFILALERREPWLTAELACWRRRAGIADNVPDGLPAGPFALELAGEHQAAAAAWRDLGDRYEAALALAGADEEDALRHAHAEFQALGAQPAAAIVARRLRARGARNLPRGPRARTRENPAGLTGRELEVLALLAEGLRNAEIASRLVVSEKTVDHHVSAILRKLDVRSRGQAGAQAIRLGLLDGVRE